MNCPRDAPCASIRGARSPGNRAEPDSSFTWLHRLENFTLCSLFWRENDGKTHTWALLNYVLLGNGFSPLEVQFLPFSRDTCRNTSPPSKASEMPRSRWLLVKRSLEKLNPFGRVFISHLDAFKMIPLHLLRLHYPCAGQSAKAISTLCSPTHFLKTGGHHRPALLCKSCVRGPRIRQAGRKNSLLHIAKKIPVCSHSQKQRKNKVRKGANI